MLTLLSAWRRAVCRLLTSWLWTCWLLCWVCCSSFWLARFVWRVSLACWSSLWTCWIWFWRAWTWDWADFNWFWSFKLGKKSFKLHRLSVNGLKSVVIYLKTHKNVESRLSMGSLLVSCCSISDIQVMSQQDQQILGIFKEIRGYVWSKNNDNLIINTDFTQLKLCDWAKASMTLTVIQRKSGVTGVWGWGVGVYLLSAGLGLLKLLLTLGQLVLILLQLSLGLSQLGLGLEIQRYDMNNIECRATNLDINSADLVKAERVVRQSGCRHAPSFITMTHIFKLQSMKRHQSLKNSPSEHESDWIWYFVTSQVIEYDTQWSHLLFDFWSDLQQYMMTDAVQMTISKKCENTNSKPTLYWDSTLYLLWIINVNSDQVLPLCPHLLPLQCHQVGKPTKQTLI